MKANPAWMLTISLACLAAVATMSGAKESGADENPATPPADASSAGDVAASPKAFIDGAGPGRFELREADCENVNLNPDT